MNELIKKLNLSKKWESDGVCVLKNNSIMVQVIEPHKGSDFKWVIRADYEETFERWGVCFYEAKVEDLGCNLSPIISDLRLMIARKDKLIESHTKENGKIYYEISSWANKLDWNF